MRYSRITVIIESRITDNDRHQVRHCSKYITIIDNNPGKSVSQKKLVCFRQDMLVDNYNLLLIDNDATR